MVCLIYYASVHLGEFNAPAQHVRGYCTALGQAGRQYTLVRPEARLFGSKSLERAGGNDIPYRYPVASCGLALRNLRSATYPMSRLDG